MYRVKPYESAHWPITKRALYKLYNKLWRDTKRQQIMARVAKLSPCPMFSEKEPSYTLHSLIGKNSLSMGIASYKSLVLTAQKPLNFIFHDDGTLNPSQLALLTDHFPGCRTVSRKESDEYMKPFLLNFPLCANVRQSHVLIPKITDVYAYSAAQRVGYVDSDVLFFQHPKFFLDQLENPVGKNFFNKDIKTSYILSASQLSNIYSILVKEQINSGLWIMNRADINLSQLNSWLQEKSIQSLHHKYLLEQTFLAVLASNSPEGVDYLPTDYDVSFEKKVEESVCKHYVGRIRHGFELEGLSYLLESTKFIQRWEEFVNAYKP